MAVRRTEVMNTLCVNWLCIIMDGLGSLRTMRSLWNHFRPFCVSALIVIVLGVLFNDYHRTLALVVTILLIGVVLSLADYASERRRKNEDK